MQYFLTQGFHTQYSFITIIAKHTESFVDECETLFLIGYKIMSMALNYSKFLIVSFI